MNGNLKLNFGTNFIETHFIIYYITAKFRTGVTVYD